MSDRKCVGCGQFKDKDKLIKITKENVSGDMVIKYLADPLIFVIIILV